MTTLVVGASGATGSRLVEQLLNLGQNVKVIVRSTGKTPDSWENNEKITIIKAPNSNINIDEMRNYLIDCESVASCPGHNINLREFLESRENW
jgi:nucleoside-diphosphate-sugar epimerase